MSIPFPPPLTVAERLHRSFPSPLAGPAPLLGVLTLNFFPPFPPERRNKTPLSVPLLYQRRAIPKTSPSQNRICHFPFLTKRRCIILFLYPSARPRINQGCCVSLFFSLTPVKLAIRRTYYSPTPGAVNSQFWYLKHSPPPARGGLFFPLRNMNVEQPSAIAFLSERSSGV